MSHFDRAHTVAAVLPTPQRPYFQLLHVCWVDGKCNILDSISPICLFAIFSYIPSEVVGASDCENAENVADAVGATGRRQNASAADIEGAAD